MTDLTTAFERCDLSADAVDSVLKLLADEGVDVIEAPHGKRGTRTAADSEPRRGELSPATWSGSTSARSAASRC